MSFLKQIHFQILGEPTDKTPIVFLHGLMGYALNWRRIATAFQGDRQILIYDQRGHGRSFKPDQGYAPEDYADDLGLILHEIGWTQIDLVGHSMGGRNALNFAYRFPKVVRRFVIEDIGPQMNPGSLERIQRLVQLVPVPFLNKIRAKDFFMNEFPKLLAGNPQAQTLGPYFYANMQEGEDGLVSWRFNVQAILSSLSAGREKERWQEWEDLIMPTLVVRGEGSEDLSRETYLQMLERNHLSRGVEIQGAGHWVHFDQPDLFIRVLRNFFDSSESEIFRQNFDFLGLSS